MASTFIRRRLILLDAEVLAHRGDFERILVHELFHFVWVRLSNAVRRDWERTLAREFVRGGRGELGRGELGRGELGWSAQRRKLKLSAADAKSRPQRWRLYACESFCDTAAWRFAGLKAHPEFTLRPAFRRVRRAWFDRHIGAGPLLI